MPQVGFIRSKNEIKYLILYIADRLIAPVPFEVMQELTMCDPAIDFFEFTECLNFLVDTDHMTCSKDYLYAITDKGVQNGRICADEIPYSVRLKAEKLAQAENQRIKRERQVRSNVTSRVDGRWNVELRFNDDIGFALWRMELVVPDEARARDLSQRFQEHPERMYNDLIRLLYPQKEAEQAPEAPEAADP